MSGCTRGRRSERTREQNQAYVRDRCRVVESGCWEWTASRYAGGYGYVCIYGGAGRTGRTTIGAHRLSYQAFTGPIPDGMFVCHRCDNKCCVNPEHLFLGTHVDNMQDMLSKGRGGSQAIPGLRAGTMNGRATLTENDVRSIRQRYSAGETQPSLAREFGILQSHVSRIILRKAWKNLPDAELKAVMP